MTIEPLVRATAKRFASHLHPAEDLAQELRLKALKVGDSPILPISLRRHAIDIVTGHRQWTGHIAVLGRSGHGGRHSDAMKVSQSLGDGVPTAILATSDSYQDLDVRAAVRSLPMPERRYVYLRFWEDRTNEEAAALAGVGKNAWGKSIRAKLRECLTPRRSRSNLAVALRGADGRPRAPHPEGHKEAGK